MHLLFGGCILWCTIPLNVNAQKEGTSLPPIQMKRADEDYSFLNQNDSVHFFLRPLKFIRLDHEGKYYLTLGGEYRARMEHFTNKDYSPVDLTYYSQRIDAHFSLQLGSRIRVFGELYHAFTSDSIISLEYDEIDVHQAFVDWTLLGTRTDYIRLRVGRQEMGYGASRLIDIREGPNMRRSFDMARLMLQKGNIYIHLFVGKEVRISPYAFDNQSNLFRRDELNPTFWGVYYRKPVFQTKASLDLYYLGFHANISQFNDVTGEETRHAVGVRSFGTFGRFEYNTEAIFQFGDLEGNQILAYNVEADWTYRLSERFWKPTLGIKLDFSSGDGKANDGKIGTFNPFFVNPAIYSLAAVNTPANLTSFHPNITFYPLEGLSINFDYAFFYRTRSADGLYSPPRFLNREADGIDNRHIGDTFGVQLFYQIDRNITFSLRSSYFIAGKFIELSGDSENTFYVAPTVSFRF